MASTGVIGRRYPIERILAGVAAMPARPAGLEAERAAAGIMTTDTVAKVATATVGGGPARVVGIAKGVGMIEPDMATMIAVLLTDADVDPTELDDRFRRVVDRTFNCVSIDTDTSTSDTAVVLASGAAGPVDGDELEAALGDVAESLDQADRPRRRGRRDADRGRRRRRPRRRARPSGWPRRSSTRRW